MYFTSTSKAVGYYDKATGQMHFPDLLWECIMIRDKDFQLSDWLALSNVCQKQQK